MGAVVTRKRQPYSDGKVHVMAERCSTCVFHAGNLMRLEEGRLKDLLEQNLERDTALICHKTIYEPEYVQKAVCRGFYDAYASEVTPLRMAIALDVIEETDGKN